MIKSEWRIEFVTGPTTLLLLDYGEAMEKEPDFSWTQNVIVTAPIFLPFASAYPLGGAPGQVSWSRVRPMVRPRTVALQEAATMPWGVTGYLRVSIQSGGVMVYLRSAIKSVIPSWPFTRDRLIQTYTADLGAPSVPMFVNAALDVTTRAVGVAGTIFNPTITGGLAAYTVTLATGALPPGYTVSSAGVITGTPTTPGSYSWTLKITDARGAAALYDYTFTVT